MNPKLVSKDYDLLKDIDLRSVVKESTQKVLKEKVPVTEAYISEPKTFKQTSNMVSQKTKDGHQELYLNYVKESNRVSAELDTVNLEEANSSHSENRSLKLDETYNLNAKVLHELYFANCFDPNSQIFMDSNAYMKLQRDFGDFESWQQSFLACAMSCGEGYAICAYNIYLKRYVNTIISNHSQDVMVGLIPVIVLDCWSHAYHRDYVIDKKSYAIAMMREFAWRTIEDRFTVAEKIASVFK
jgi:Fe-Mn family superoxide dismutase